MLSALQNTYKIHVSIYISALVVSINKYSGEVLHYWNFMYVFFNVKVFATII